MEERLQKFLARCGVASRRKAEGLIQSGAVRVNGERITELGTKVDPARDRVEVHGRPVTSPRGHRYLMLWKPAGYVCTRRRFPGERSVYELIPDGQTLLIAGRLDKESEGLVLLTDDGDLVFRLTHPRYGHEKEYEVRTRKPILDADIEALRRGIHLTEGMGKADRVTRLSNNTIRLILHQGWKRQIRRMLETLHHEVVSLQRVRLGAFVAERMRDGEIRSVTRQAIEGAPDR
ncbi:MAG: rRNA pseudouridine synthase [Candidatus Kerfeldbacteria bacterium]|nr:rRNA pseudouridine synthase [Candidatus Kerfeldbacteria bacterium]